MDEVPRGDLVLGCIFVILLLMAYAVAGTFDWMDEQAYKQAWSEAHGIEMEASWQ